MAACNHHASLAAFRDCAIHDASHHSNIKAGREAHQAHRKRWLPAHGVDIGDGIRRSYLTEYHGIIHHRREEIDSLDQHPSIAQIIHQGIIRALETLDQSLVPLLDKPVQRLVEIPRRKLCIAAGAPALLDLFFPLLANRPPQQGGHE